MDPSDAIVNAILADPGPGFASSSGSYEGGRKRIHDTSQEIDTSRDKRPEKKAKKSCEGSPLFDIHYMQIDGFDPGQMSLNKVGNSHKLF